ncbi:MAG: glycosyltransferase family 2 protein [Chloroflexi bacterium]|nr:glycosyltransferase family 2 protein [Chloroflexota bacterium]
MSISIIVHTLNEEHNIRACLETAKWADEIVIVDMYSDDKTVEIAREFTESIYFYERADGFAEPARNFGLSKAQSDWIYILDADERIPPELQAEIIETIKNPGDTFVYRVLMRDYMFGKWVEHGLWNQQWQIRLFKKGYVSWPPKVHATPEAVGPIGYFKNPFFHYSQVTISRFIVKMNTYTDIMAREWYEQGKKANLLKTFAGSIIAFFKDYFYRQGFRDGGHGFILSVLWAIYYFVPRVKLWELHYKAAKDTLTPPRINYRKAIASARTHRWRSNVSKFLAEHRPKP